MSENWCCLLQTSDTLPVGLFMYSLWVGYFGLSHSLQLSSEDEHREIERETDWETGRSHVISHDPVPEAKQYHLHLILYSSGWSQSPSWVERKRKKIYHLIRRGRRQGFRRVVELEILWSLLENTVCYNVLLRPWIFLKAVVHRWLLHYGKKLIKENKVMHRLMIKWWPKQYN